MFEFEKKKRDKSEGKGTLGGHVGMQVLDSRWQEGKRRRRDGSWLEVGRLREKGAEETEKMGRNPEKIEK